MAFDVNPLDDGDVDSHGECRHEIHRLTKELEVIKAGIRDDDVWADDWCPVCHEHPSHNHGGKDCPMKEE